MKSTNILMVFLLLILIALTPLVWRRGAPLAPNRIPVTVLAQAEHRIYHLDLESYLVGVVAAEMPAKFSLEALKAQAVAARTIAVHRLKRFGGKGCQHYQGADFCDDPGENQAWLSPKSLQQKWDRNYNEYYFKIKRAIKECAGVIMTYNQRPIDAVFHSTCGIGTANAAEVWHFNIPYLKRVSCGYDHHSPRYRNRSFFTWFQLVNKFHLPENCFRHIKVTTRSSDGRILWLSLGDFRITGTEFRKVLGLTSNYFYWRPVKTGLDITAIGYGHGVGMCQYGADGMGKLGFNYQQILRHYYQGISFRKIKN